MWQALFAVVLALAPISFSNLRSQLHSYNALGQLTGSKVGTLDLSGAEPVITPATLRREDQWRLDVLGNWNGNRGWNDTGPAPGRITSVQADLPGSMSPFTTSFRDLTDGQNRLTTRVADPGAAATATHLSFDAAGNLTCDGLYFYQYDAWNRLVQVNRATAQPVSPDVLASDGHTYVNYIWVPDPDKMLKHNTYDGLGRLIRTQSPYPNVDYPNHGVRSEHFYYDGIRRIQELVVDPLFNMDDAGESGNQSVEDAANQAQNSSPYLLDGSANPMSYEQAQVDSPLPVTVYLEREYVWGPGDRGVDELLVQYDHTVNRNPWWVIQDDGGDVVAVCDSGGANGKGRVVQQWTYDAYGEALTSTTLQPHPIQRCGHKALFVDRLDAGVVSSNWIEYERIIPFGHVLCQNRNRVYSPQMGRFLQPDPNETGMALLAATGFGGRGAAALSIAFGLESHYGNGLNAYEYLGSNPWNRGDPMGLSWDPFTMVDEYLAEDAGSKAAFLERVIGVAAAAAYVGSAILSNIPFPIAMAAGTMGMIALEGEIPPEVRAFAKVLGVVTLGGLVATIGKIAIKAATTAIQYVAKHGLRGVAQQGWSLAKRAWNWVGRKLSRTKSLCGCFAAGTVVWTMAGIMPIEKVSIGDYVVARDERSGLVQFAEVTGTIETPAAALLRVAVEHRDGRIEVIHATDEHPFWVQDRSVIPKTGGLSGAWRRADELSPGDTVVALLGEAVVVATAFTSQRQVVFNLTVKDLGTFHVGPDGILVHNCDYEFHHFYPRALWREFRRAGLSSEDLELGEHVLKDWHKRMHGKGTGLAGAWNDRWAQWLKAHPNGPPGAAKVYLEELKSEFGLLDNLAPMP